MFAGILAFGMMAGGLWASRKTAAFISVIIPALWARDKEVIKRYKRATKIAFTLEPGVGEGLHVATIPAKILPPKLKFMSKEKFILFEKEYDLLEKVTESLVKGSNKKTEWNILHKFIEVSRARADDKEFMDELEKSDEE